VRLKTETAKRNEMKKTYAEAHLGMPINMTVAKTKWPKNQNRWRTRWNEESSLCF
jgi:hypothetical protein